VVRRWRLAHSSGQRGAAAVEFALVVPLLLVLLFGVMQFGWLMNSYLMVNQATSSGSRLFSTQRGFDNPCTKAFTAVTSAAAGLTTANITMSCSVNGAAACSTCAGGSCATDASCKTQLISNAGNPATVTVSYAFTPLIANSLSALNMPTELSATATDQVQ
jgi:Flp pilus assembly protein TadG